MTPIGGAHAIGTSVFPRVGRGPIIGRLTYRVAAVVSSSHLISIVTPAFNLWEQRVCTRDPYLHVTNFLLFDAQHLAAIRRPLAKVGAAWGSQIGVTMHARIQYKVGWSTAVLLFQLHVRRGRNSAHPKVARLSLRGGGVTGGRRV
ncbi:MAG: hypothetical protein FRX49_00882 [Trebouxia sp. A1-2]|nr:MAG: hypothetical protein FRX49_00882 [Trebouxia sp. A1-2]